MIWSDSPKPVSYTHLDVYKRQELARLVHVKANTMSQYENGMRKVPLDVLAGVARVLKCTVMDLAYEEMGMAARCV